ncbi:hypothetical protein IGI04_007382, partial [Brassica rapa subsp. trilocularis]
MGSEEDDETFVRRNKLLQEAITKQVMEAMVKLLEEKYDQRPNDGQGQASGQRREQRRNRQGQREHAGSEETDNFYERSSHSSGNDGNGKSLVAYTGASSSRSNDDYIKRSDLDALFKMLKENGNTYGYSFGASMIAYKDDHLIRELVE